MPPLLTAEDLTKHFPRPRDAAPIEVLRGVSLTLETGEAVSIRGASGCGKSTLLNILAGLETPTTGNLCWRGEDVLAQGGRWRSQQRAALFGFVFQAFYLVPELNAVENVLLARRVLGGIRSDDRQRAESLLDQVGLADRATQLPAKLSGGERQRVAVARALMNRPPLLLADEPTGNLDERTADQVMDLLFDLAEGPDTTLLLVTHDPRFAARCARQLYLHDGALHDQPVTDRVAVPS